MADTATREAGISVLMRPWAEEVRPAARPAPPRTRWQRFWRALGLFIFDYNRY